MLNHYNKWWKRTRPKITKSQQLSELKLIWVFFLCCTHQHISAELTVRGIPHTRSGFKSKLNWISEIWFISVHSGLPRSRDWRAELIQLSWNSKSQLERKQERINCFWTELFFSLHNDGIQLSYLIFRVHSNINTQTRPSYEFSYA